MEELGLSIAQYLVFGSILKVGGIIGAALSGWVADRIGRRRALWLTKIFLFSGWLEIAFAKWKDALCLDIGRISIGFGIGLVLYVMPIYIAEIAPKSVRGGFTLANQIVTGIGFGLLFSVGNFLSWRTLALIGAFTCVVQFTGLFFIPKSPRLLDYTESCQQVSGGRFLDLFQMRYARALTSLHIDILSGFVTDVSIVVGTTGIAILQILTALIAVFLMDKCGRRPLLLISSSGFGFCWLVVSIAFCLQEHEYMKHAAPLMVLFATWGAAAFFKIGMSGVPLVIMSEIFPMNVKGSGGSVITSVNLAGSWITTYSFNFVLEWSIPGTFFIFAGFGSCLLYSLQRWCRIRKEDHWRDTSINH